MSQTKETLLMSVVGLVLVALGVVLGRASVDRPPAEVRTVEVVKWKEKTVWASQGSASTTTTATAAKTEKVRIVTRWLRPDGSAAKEQVRESGAESRSAAASASSASQSATGAREAEGQKTVERVVELRPRFQAQGFLGLDLGAGLERRWGGAVSVRIAGPVWISGIAFPQMGLYGAGVGVTW